MLDRLVFTMFPVQLNTLSEGTLVAGMHKYLVAKHDRTLYRKLLSFHHSKGLWLSFFEAESNKIGFSLK